MSSGTAYLSARSTRKARKKRKTTRTATNTVRVLAVPDFSRDWLCPCAECLAWTAAQP